jgi:hypothetical protein
VIVAGALLAAALLAEASGPDAGGDAGARDGAPGEADGGEVGAAREGGGGDAGAAITSDGGGTDATPVPPAVGRVTGQILARGTRAPVAGAALIADASEVGGTDARGGFTIEVPCGRRHLTIQAPGFEPLAAEVEVCAAAPEPLTLRLTPAASGTAYETVVRAKTPHPEVRLANEELTQTPGTLGDPFRAIESLPGVTTIAWPAPIYAVRGSNPGNTGFFLDGIGVPALFHFALGPSVIHPYFFDSLEFYPGGYPAYFGRYVAGIVAADTRAPATDRPHASVDVRLFDAGAIVTAPLPGGGAVAVAGRYSYTAELVSLLNEDVRLDYWDYQLRVDRRVGPFQLTLLAFGSNDVLVPGHESDTVREVDLGFHRVSLRAVLPLGGGRLQGSVAVGSDHTRAPILDLYPITIDAVSAAPRLGYARWSEAADVAVGFDGQLARYDPVLLGDLHPPSDWDLGQRRDAVLLAGYASATLRAIPRLVLTPELRFDSYEVGGTTARDLGPRLSARLALRDDLAVKLAGGRFSQLPSLPLQIPGVDAFGLRLLGLQTSWQASVGVETTRVRAVELAVTGYVQRYVLSDLRNPRPINPDPLADDFLVKRDAVSYGLELLARRPLTQRLYGWVSYTLSNNLKSYGGGAVGPSDWDQRHVFNVVAGYRWGRTTFGARAHYNTGRPYITYDTTYGTETEYFHRLPPFYQLDVRVDRRIVYDRFQLDVYAELVNATLNREVYAVSETPAGDWEQRSFRVVLPSIGVRGEF